MLFLLFPVRLVGIGIVSGGQRRVKAEFHIKQPLWCRSDKVRVEKTP
jgi:hypothetical protein